MSLALQEMAAPKTSAPTGALAGARLYLVGFHKWVDSPQWLVYFMENLVKIDDLGTPISGNH